MDSKLFRRVRGLFAATLMASVATIGVAAVVGADAAVWIRSIIVIIVAGVLIILAEKAFRGSRRAYLRMRVMCTAAPVAIVVIVALPHDGFPVWMKVEQVLVGALLLTAAVWVNRKAVRQAYARNDQQVQRA